jgi:hypothetical protein
MECAEREHQGNSKSGGEQHCSDSGGTASVSCVLQTDDAETWLLERGH